MRTTIDIEDDVLLAVKELARRRKTTAGKVLSELARVALRQGPHADSTADPVETYGFEPFPTRGGLVTNDMIDRLREEADD